MKAVGSTTLTAKRTSCDDEFGFTCFDTRDAVQLLEVLCKVGEARTHGAILRILAGEGIGGLETVAGDADDGGLVGGDAAIGVETGGDGGGDAAGGLGEDALGLGELLHAADDLDVRDVLGPSIVGLDHLGRGGTVGGV